VLGDLVKRVTEVVRNKVKNRDIDSPSPEDLGDRKALALYGAKLLLYPAGGPGADITSGILTHRDSVRFYYRAVLSMRMSDLKDVNVEHSQKRLGDLIFKAMGVEGVVHKIERVEGDLVVGDYQALRKGFARAEHCVDNSTDETMVQIILGYDFVPNEESSLEQQYASSTSSRTTMSRDGEEYTIPDRWWDQGDPTVLSKISRTMGG